MSKFLHSRPKTRSALARLNQCVQVREVTNFDEEFQVDLMPGFYCVTTSAHSFNEGTPMQCLHRIRTSVVRCDCDQCKTTLSVKKAALP